MNIKRALFALSAMLIGIGCFTAFPQQAHATVVVCTNTDPASTQYPYGEWSKRCGANLTVNDGQAMSSLINGMAGLTELRRANNGNLPDAQSRPRNGVRYFLFEKPQDYIDSASSLGLVVQPVGMYDFGVTYFDNNKIPVYSAVFKTNFANRTFPGAIRNGTATQAARALDYLQGYIKNGGIQPTVNFRMSDTGAGFRSMFEQNLEVDFAAINNLLPCKNPTTSAFGLFSNYSDKDGVFICNGINGNGTALIPMYSALSSNRARLNKAWPHIYPLAPSGVGTAPLDYYAGFYAELYAAKVVSPVGVDTVTTGQTQDAYFNKGFACSIWFAKTIPAQGKLLNTNIPAQCVEPTSLMITKCQKLFAATGGQFPNGNVFNCTVNSAAVVQQVQQKLNGLGRNAAAAQEVTNIKSEFSRRRANIFIFDLVSDYQSAFNAAGEFVPAGVISTIASTYPNPTSLGIWNTIMFRTQNDFAFSSAELAYTATHELGHVFDDTRSPQASSTTPTPYDRAVQNDWLKLDYVNFAQGVAGQRKPCGTFALDQYVGPLTDVNDPTTITVAQPDGVPFCNGNVIRAPYTSTMKTSEILRSVYAQAADAPRRQLAGHIGPNSPNGYNTLLGWRELHSEAFAVRAQSDVATVPPAINMPQIVANGYFSCIAGPVVNGFQSWARTEYITAGVPSAPPCQTALPGGPGGWVDIH